MDFSLISNTFITIFTTDVFFLLHPGRSGRYGHRYSARPVRHHGHRHSDSPHLLAGTPRRAWLCCWASITPPFGPAASPPSLSTRPAPRLHRSDLRRLLHGHSGQGEESPEYEHHLLGHRRPDRHCGPDRLFLPRGGVCPEVRPPEMFAMALFGLSMMIGVSGGSVFKGLLARRSGPVGLHHWHGPHDRCPALHLWQHQHAQRH